MATPERERATQLIERINCYLGNGGFFNPEMMDHDKVRDLLLDAREALLSACDPSPQPAPENGPKIGSRWRDNDERQHGRLVRVVAFDPKRLRISYRNEDTDRLAVSRWQRFKAAFTEQPASPLSGAGSEPT